jgi:hypothetical protein
MTAREKVALKNGDIKLFLMPQELALVVSCLNWVQADLMRAADTWKETNTDIKRDLPVDTFNYLIPVIQMTTKSILLHSRAHYEERHDEKGRQLLIEKIDELDKETSEVQALVRTINRAVVTKNIKNQN